MPRLCLARWCCSIGLLILHERRVEGFKKSPGVGRRRHNPRVPLHLLVLLVALAEVKYKLEGVVADLQHIGIPSSARPPRLRAAPVRFHNHLCVGHGIAWIGGLPMHPSGEAKAVPSLSKANQSPQLLLL